MRPDEPHHQATSTQPPLEPELRDLVINRTSGDPTLGLIAEILNIAIWLVFAAELVCILWVTPHR
jgi:hypothetical protein